MINISKININTNINTDEHNVLALVSIIIDDSIVVDNIKLMNGKDGPYLVFPVNDRNKFIANPITEETRQYILNKILDEMRKHNGFQRDNK